MIYLFIGQPGAGKSEMAKMLVDKLGEKTIWIDGDDLREIFPNKDYSYYGRIKNIERSFIIARFMSEKGYNVVISMVCPYRAAREDLKANNKVIEVLFNRSHFAGKDSYHVQEFEYPILNFEVFINGDNREDDFEKLLDVLNLESI